MAVVQNYLPGDPLLIDKIVYELKSQGIFDQFRKECIADVDTKPAYQNLRQRVEGSVSGFLNKQTWSSDMNKNQVREMLRKNIYESGFLETGVERIVDQVVNPKINSVFLPKVTEIVYKFLGIEKHSSEKKENVKQVFNNDNLLPTDLEAVSPESEKKFDISNDSQNLDDSKIDEDESPPFEPLDEKFVYVPPEENSVDSHLSGFSGLMSHDSNHSQEFSKPTQMVQMEVSNQDSMLSKQSSEGRLSIVMSDDNDTKMEICEDLQQQKVIKSNYSKLKTFDFAPEISNKNSDASKKIEKSEEKLKSDKNKSHEKHRSRHDSKSERKDDKEKKVDKERKEHRHRQSSKDKGKERDRKDSRNGSSKSEKDKLDGKNDRDSKSDGKIDKDRSKSSSSSSNRHSSSSRDKDKNSSSSSSRKESSSSSKDRGDNKERSKSSSSRDKDSKHKDDKSKSESKSSSKHESKTDKHKKDDKHRSERHSSSSKSRDKDKRDSKKEKKENKDDHFSSKKKSVDRRSTDRDSNDGQSGLKSSSSSFDSYASLQTQSKGQESSNSNSNTGSGDSGNSDAVEEFSISSERTRAVLNAQVQNIPILKLIKPKFASNIHEARRLMKIRKQLTLLEKQNAFNLTQIMNHKSVTNECGKVNATINKVNSDINNTTVRNHDNNKKQLKQKKTVIPGSPVKTKKCTPEPLSPPLKSSVVSAATWDALEAKLHESLKYSTTYEEIADVAEVAVVSVNSNEGDCLYLEVDSKDSKSQSYMQFISKYVWNLQSSIEKYSIGRVQGKTLQARDHENNGKKRLKRKYSEYHSDLKNNNNNNKKFNTHHIEVHENFTLPLSPAESDKSIDKKSDTSESSSDKTTKKTETAEFMERVKKTIRAPAKSQRYSSEDLYKPRPLFSGSRRRAGRNLELD